MTVRIDELSFTSRDLGLPASAIPSIGVAANGSLIYHPTIRVSSAPAIPEVMLSVSGC